MREGRDYPLEFGKEWQPSTNSRKGIMLMVHGCNPVGALGGLMLSWINSYRAAGFHVFLPNSFAEIRDGEMCGNPGENGIDQQTRILKLRIAQTRDTRAGLREKFPKDPIYLHGHSEGGYVVQAVNEKVAGIIVTGSPCGFGYSSAYWAQHLENSQGSGWVTDGYVLDAREGGREEGTFRFRDGPPIRNEMPCLDVVADLRLVFSYCMFVDGKRISVSLATIELLPEASGTKLVYTEQAAFLDGADTLESRLGGCEELFDALGRELARHAA